MRVWKCSWQHGLYTIVVAPSKEAAALHLRQWCTVDESMIELVTGPLKHEGDGMEITDVHLAVFKAARETTGGPPFPAEMRSEQPKK